MTITAPFCVVLAVLAAYLHMSFTIAGHPYSLPVIWLAVPVALAALAVAGRLAMGVISGPGLRLVYRTGS